VSRRVAALGCLAVVVGADALIRRRPPWIVVGLLDHPAHVATAGLVLLNLPGRPREWRRGFLAGSVLPDLDHLPLLLSRVHPDLDDPRPATHCLVAVGPVFVAAAVCRRHRRALGGAAAGTLAHFARDLGVGTGVALLRPLTARSFRVRYAGYAAACLALAARAATLSSRRDSATLQGGL
jgi:hypothetical protein